MTEQPQFQEPTPTVVPAPDSRLGQLLAEFAELKPTFDAAEKRMKELKDGIKYEVHQAVMQPDGTVPELINIDATDVPPFELAWVPKRELDVSRIKKERPDIYAFFLASKGAWYLRKAKG